MITLSWGIPLATGVGSGVTEDDGHKKHFLTGFGIGLGVLNVSVFYYVSGSQKSISQVK